MGTRTIFLVNTIPPYRVKLLEALRDRLDQLRILISTEMEPNRTWAPDWGDLDVVVQKTKTFKWSYRHPSGFSFQSFVHVPLDTMSLLRRSDPDFVISAELGTRTLMSALYCRLHRSHCRLIIWATLSEQTELGWGAFRHFLRRILLRSADAVFVNGKSGFRYIESLGVPKEHIAILNQPVDISLFTQAKPERSAEVAYRLIYVGQMIARKGVDLFQAALLDYARSHPERLIEILWVGDGELRAALESVRGPDNLHQRFLDAVQYDAIPALYLTAGIGVLPSMMDEWGLVVNEGMASGLPMLGSVYSQAVDEMVQEGETGWRFVPSKQDMLDAIDRALSTPLDRLAQMRLKARARACAITFDDIAERAARVVQTIESSRLSAKSKQPTL